MTLDLSETDNDVNVYFTNWGYLRIMSFLQKILLKGMKWDGEYIRDGFDSCLVPSIIQNALVSGTSTEDSVNYFINDLEDEIMRL